MENSESINIDDLCRLCLTRKSSTTSFIRMNENHVAMFTELTNRELPLNENYPQYACMQCCIELENFYAYKNRLITKQEEIEIILFNYAVTEVYLDDDTQSDVLEEYIEESEDLNDDESSQSLEMPSIKNLKQPNSTDIVKLIEEIEKRNEIIFESSKPTVAIRKRSMKKKEQKVTHKEKIRKVERREVLKVEKLAPKLILSPSTETNHACKSCSDKFPSQLLLKRHILKNHHKQEPMECSDQVFKLNQDPKKHDSNCVPKNPVKCAKCDKTLKNKKTLKFHLKSHLPKAQRKFKCSWKNCTKSFNAKVHLENHVRMHQREKTFTCPQCPIAFKQKHQIAIHVKQKH